MTTNIVEIYETINQINSLKEKLKEDVLKYISNDQIDIDTRWDIFYNSGVGDHNSTTPSFVNNNIYEDNGGPVFLNRMETVTAQYVLCECEELDWFDAQQFKLDCMKNCIRSWTFDW